MSEEGEVAERGGIASVFLVGAVGAILLAGMVLKSGQAAKPGDARASSTPPNMALPLGTTVTQEIIPATTPPPIHPPDPLPETVAPDPVPPDPVLVRLATRASNDVARLGKSPRRFTAQLLVACKPETVARMLDTSHGSPNLYVLPAQVRDEACFRVCYGTYATGKDASAAADLPKSLRGKDRLASVEIAKVLP